MRRSYVFILAALCVVGLVVATAGVSKSARSTGKSTCQAKILGFAQLQSIHKQGVTYYQYAIRLRASAPKGNTVGGEYSFSGGGGERIGLRLSQRRPGNITIIDWTNTAFGATHSHKESFTMDMLCYANPGGIDYVYAPNVRTSAQLYKAGEAQPFVQPWVNACPDWLVIDSRGSGEPTGTISPPGEVFANTLRVGYYTPNWYDTQFVIESLANPYPAKGDILKYIEAKLPLPLAYRQSKAAGVKWLKAELGKLSQHCPKTAVLLSGYSQGAQVTGDAYQSQAWTNVRGAVMFGDLKFNPTDLSDHGNFDRTAQLPFGHLLHGYLGKRPEFGTLRVWTFCHLHDPACQGWTQAKYGFRYHKYDKNGEPQIAARYFRLG